MKVIIPRGCRSDYPLSDPIIKAMESDDFFRVFTINLHPANFVGSFDIMDHFCKTVKPDLVMIIGDRVEMAGAANAVFLNNIPICHLGAGIINDPISCFDDIFRHNITSMAEIALCEDYTSAKKVAELWYSINKIKEFPEEGIYEDRIFSRCNIHNVGNPYADGLDTIDLSLVPDEPYNLVLINPTTLKPDILFDNIPKDLLNIKTIKIGSNPDSNPFSNWKITLKHNNLIQYDNLPRPQFLGLLSKCERYISNSSNVYYEAPYYLKPEQIIHIGRRNMNRSTPTNLEGGSTVKIIEILKKWWNDKND